MVFQPLSLTNTYFEWLTTTNQIITSLNLNTAPIAFNTANAAFANGNTNFVVVQSAFGQANTARTQANAAFDQANTSNNLTVANTGSIIGSRNILNFVPGGNVSITFTDDAAGNRINVNISAIVSNNFLTMLTRDGNTVNVAIN